MIQKIAPLQYFPISRVLPDPSDVTVYYIMAEVRNGSTGVLLASVKLLSQGGQIYSGVYRAPALASSQGLFLTITTRVYTDAGYTVPSQIYGNDSDTFQVFDEANNAIIMAQQIAATVAGSIPDNSPADVNYKKIEKLVAKALEALLPGLMAEFKKVHDRIDTLDTKTDLSPALEAIAGISTDLNPVIEAINAKEPNYDNLALTLHKLFEPLHQGMSALRTSMPEAAPTLDPILERLDKLLAPSEAKSSIKEVHGAVQNTLALVTTMAQKHGEVADGVKDIQKRVKKMPILSTMQPEDDEPELNEFGRKVEKVK